MRWLRHIFGTRWLQAGDDIYKLSKIPRHSSVAVTEAHYAHLLNEDPLRKGGAGAIVCGYAEVST